MEKQCNSCNIETARGVLHPYYTHITQRSVEVPGWAVVGPLPVLPRSELPNSVLGVSQTVTHSLTLVEGWSPESRLTPLSMAGAAETPRDVLMSPMRSYRHAPGAENIGGSKVRTGGYSFHWITSYGGPRSDLLRSRCCRRRQRRVHLSATFPVST